ncbi:hypothetical protein FGIG_01728 [Fasciola gigantica]|uniref:Uncharacterized protein n=1 Tax=Fasciola gigantica TaxID=46835 RepID=A0A504YX59_FASGI|nr:hypothetical protein FGIG_01728 [Fasciola gigantica]
MHNCRRNLLPFSVLELIPGSQVQLPLSKLLTYIFRSLTARLEFEWVFLPQGLPVEVDRDPLGELEQLRHIPRVGTLTGHQTSYLDRPNGVITLPALLNLCKSASLDGAEAALKATSDSFRPFLLDTVTMHELENSACYKAKQLTGRTPVGSSPLNPWGVGETGGAKLGDTDWLGLTSDNSRLFGLPLKHHIRKQPYMFRFAANSRSVRTGLGIRMQFIRGRDYANVCLQIYSVDQKTPISVGFTVEVQDWFGADTDTETRPGYLVSGRLPNHRVRLRIMPTTTGSTWTIEPINSLDYRWHLSTAIDRFLRPHCPPPCNPDVGIWEMNKHESNAIFVVWAQLSLLMENTKLDPRIKDGDSLTSDTSSNAQSICPWEKLNRLQNLLTFAPSVVSVEKNKGLVTGYAANRQIFLAPWAAPSAPFRNHLATSGLGTVEAAVVDRMGVCARGNGNKSEAITSNLKMGQLLNTSGSSVHTFTIYTAGQRIGTSSWIGLEDDKVTVFGILMGNAVQPITYRFRIASDPHAQQGVTFAVFVAGSNPLLPAVYNHRVIMRFGSENGQRWVGGHSLADRWRIVLALDVFLRPQCATDPECKEDMDVLLLTFNYHVTSYPELMGPNVPPPSKPLILPNERPPLKPPEYNLAYTDSPATSPPQYHNGTPQMATAAFPSMMSSNMMAGSSPHPVPKPYYGARPNPYRNLPPPIETKPGVPFLAPQMPYAPYKRVTGMQPDISHTLPR